MKKLMLVILMLLVAGCGVGKPKVTKSPCVSFDGGPCVRRPVNDFSLPWLQ